MAVLNNGLQLLGVGADRVQIIKGLVLLLAVGIDVYSKRQGRPSIIGLLTTGPQEPASRRDAGPCGTAGHTDPHTFTGWGPGNRSSQGPDSRGLATNAGFHPTDAPGKRIQMKKLIVAAHRDRCSRSARARGRAVAVRTRAVGEETAGFAADALIGVALPAKTVGELGPRR